MAVFLDDGFQLGREGADDPVSEKHPQEGPDKRTANHLAKDFGRLVDGTHRLDDAENGGDDPKRGQAVGDRLKRVGGMERMMQAGLDLLVQHLFDLMRIVVVHRGRAHRVADQLHRLVILRDLGVFPKDRGAFRLFDMGFERDGIAARKADQLEEQAEKIAVIAGLPLRALEDLADVFHRLLDSPPVA